MFEFYAFCRIIWNEVVKQGPVYVVFRRLVVDRLDLEKSKVPLTLFRRPYLS